MKILTRSTLTLTLLSGAGVLAGGAAEPPGVPAPLSCTQLFPYQKFIPDAYRADSSASDRDFALWGRANSSSHTWVFSYDFLIPTFCVGLEFAVDDFAWRNEGAWTVRVVEQSTGDPFGPAIATATLDTSNYALRDNGRIAVVKFDQVGDVPCEQDQGVRFFDVPYWIVFEPIAEQGYIELDAFLPVTEPDPLFGTYGVSPVVSLYDNDTKQLFLTGTATPPRASTSSSATWTSPAASTATRTARSTSSTSRTRSARRSASPSPSTTTARSRSTATTSISS